jgi:hypothetical protein
VLHADADCQQLPDAGRCCESADTTFGRFFDYWHEDYGANEAFDEYNTELLRGVGTLLLSGRTSFLASKDYWTSYPGTPAGTAIRREFAALKAQPRAPHLGAVEPAALE